MVRGTTPTVIIYVEGADLSIFADIELTFKQRNTMVVKKLSNGKIKIGEEDSSLRVELSQEETLRFNPEPIQIQMRGITEKGTVVASEIVFRSMDDILNESVMEYDQT